MKSRPDPRAPFACVANSVIAQPRWASLSYFKEVRVR